MTIPRSSTPLALAVAAGTLGLEAAGVLVLTVAQVSQIHVSALILGAGTSLLLAVYVVALGALARGAWLARTWCRGPIVAAQLLHLPIAWGLHRGSTAWAGWLLGLTAIVALVCVLLPSSTAVLTAGRDSPASGD